MVVGYWRNPLRPLLYNLPTCKVFDHTNLDHDTSVFSVVVLNLSWKGIQYKGLSVGVISFSILNAEGCISVCDQMRAEHPLASLPSSPLQHMLKGYSLELARCCWKLLRAPRKRKRVDTSVTYEHFKDSNIWCHYRTCPKKIKRLTNSSWDPRELILNIWFGGLLGAVTDCWYSGCQSLVLKKYFLVNDDVSAGAKQKRHFSGKFPS